MKPFGKSSVFPPGSVLVCLLCLVLASTGSAQDKIWTNGAGNGSWGGGNNWSPAGVPTAASVITTNVAGNTNTTVSGGFAISGMIENRDSGIWTIQSTNKVDATLSISGTLSKSGESVLRFTGSSNTPAGAVNLSISQIEMAGGTLDFGVFSGVTSLSSGGVHATGGLIKFNVQNDYNLGAVVMEGGVLELNSGNHPDWKIIVNSLSGVGGFIQASTGINANTTTLIANQSGNTTLASTLEDGNSGASVLALQKNGTGTLALTGVNTYTGGTVVSGGALRVDGSITGTITIEANGTLGGSGTVGDILLSGGTLASEDAPGVLHATSLAWNSGVVDLALGGSPEQSDFLDLSGNFTGSGPLHFTFEDNGWKVGTTYDLIGFESTSLSLEMFDFTNGGGFAGVFQWNNTEDPAILQFTLTSVPEPTSGTILTILGGGWIVVAGCRRLLRCGADRARQAIV